MYVNLIKIDIPLAIKHNSNTYYERFFFIHQLMHKWNVLKNYFKIYVKIDIKIAPTCFGAVTPSSGSVLLCLLKLQLLKEPFKTHRCVVMWLHILVGPCWCVYIALLGSRLFLNSATYVAVLTTVTLTSVSNVLPDDGVSAPKHVGAVLVSILM